MILCIDDEATGLMVRKILLESQGYEVLTASSGPKVWNCSCPSDEAVVLDYSMPGMNGGRSRRN